MKILHLILSTVLGLLAGVMVVAAVEWISHLMHPLPKGLDTNDIEAMGAWIKTLPVTAFLMLLVAWGGGALAAAWVARRLAPARSLKPAVVVALFLMAATISNLAMLPHPWWMWPGGILVCVTGSLIGILLSAPRQYNVGTVRSIQAPLCKVFETLSRVENFKQAVPGIQSIAFLTDRTYGEGTRFRETRLMNGKQATTILEVTELVENDRVRMVSDAGGTIWDTVFVVEQQDDMVEMTMSMDARPYNPLAKLMVPMILSMVAKAVESDMDAVKNYCERNESHA